VGGIGVSGDSSCADHNIAWKARWHLHLDNVPSGFAVVNNSAELNPPLDFDHPDNITYDIDQNGVSKSGWGHPLCPGDEEHGEHLKTIATNLPALP
jgi:hypothetical protein